MTLITEEIRARLLENGETRQQTMMDGGDAIDFWPVVKLFTPDGSATWLLTDLDPDAPDIAFGLCDLGMQSPELGIVRLSELENARGPLGMKIERDLFFKATMSLSDYADKARVAGAIRT